MNKPDLLAQFACDDEQAESLAIREARTLASIANKTSNEFVQWQQASWDKLAIRAIKRLVIALETKSDDDPVVLILILAFHRCQMMSSLMQHIWDAANTNDIFVPNSDTTEEVLAQCKRVMEAIRNK